MDKTGSKTIICSVLFLDIVEYSKKSVAVQIALKERLNGYLSAAIHSIPAADRIILDTGDGAAINFLGDIEDALKTALSLRESLCSEPADADPPMQMRAGINLGPVRLVMDINGQPNVVGDGVNVAQRIMGFAEPGQILVSRSYCEAVSRLSTHYADMFHYQGSRTDKHVREHEIFEIAQPGELSGQHAAGEDIVGIAGSSTGSFGRAWNAAAAHLDGMTGDPRVRGKMALYAAVLVAVMLVGLLAARSNRHAPALPEEKAAASAVSATETAMPAPDAPSAAMADQGARKAATDKPSATDNAASKSNSPPKGQATASSDAKTGVAGKRDAGGTYILVVCRNDSARVFVDFFLKGKVSYGELRLPLQPGRHRIVVKHDSGLVHQQKIDLAPGNPITISPRFCN